MYGYGWDWQYLLYVGPGMLLSLLATFLVRSTFARYSRVATAQGRSLLAQILFVFDEGPTPDLFCLEVERNHDGSYTQKGKTGHSILLSDIASVKPPPQ